MKHLPITIASILLLFAPGCSFSIGFNSPAGESDDPAPKEVRTIREADIISAVEPSIAKKFPNEYREFFNLHYVAHPIPGTDRWIVTVGDIPVPTGSPIAEVTDEGEIISIELVE